MLQRHLQVNAGGEAREGAWVTETAARLDLSVGRHTAFITDQEGTDIAALELCRRRAKVEDEIRCGKDTGMRN